MFNEPRVLISFSVVCRSNIVIFDISAKSTSKSVKVTFGKIALPVKPPLMWEFLGLSLQSISTFDKFEEGCT